MENWRKRGTSPDKPENSSNARPIIETSSKIENWRNRSTSPGRQENSPNSRPSTSNNRSTYFQGYQSSNFQNTENRPSSLTLQNPGRRYYGLQREFREDFWQLDDLVELNRKNSTEILIALTNQQNLFVKLLTSHLEPNCIILIIAILSKVCSSCFREIKIDILKVALNGNFLKTLERYVRVLKDQNGENRDRNLHYWNNPVEFLVNLLLVCGFFIDIIPTNYCDSLHKLLKVIRLIQFPEGTNVEEMQKIKSRIKVLMEKLNLRKAHPEQKIGTLSVYPTKKEILTSDFGLSNKYFVEGKYDNVNVYLDLQIKLLRESFTAALQQDIVQCIEHAQGPNSCIKSSPVRMYPDVVFRSMVFTDKYWQSGVIVNFSNGEDLEEIFSSSSTCLADGSVVCFTKDNFYTIFFGTIIEKVYEGHHLIIGFEPDHNNCEANASFTMVEFKIYLNPYSNILKALSYMKEDDFPLKAHLIDAVPEVESPGYMNSTSSIHLDQGSRVNVSGGNWPSADQLKLDRTQYSAFKAALTQKFVMIQGAPGTGKSYLGLQIVKTFLHEDNQKLWYNESPILIVCSTQRTLHQFLEGLISSTSRIISVGHCKSDKLKNFTLKSARKRNNVYRNVPLQWNRKMKELLEQLEKYPECFKQINNSNNILSFSNFECIDENIKTSWFFGATEADSLAWLFDEKSHNLHSLKISEIIKNIIEEQKQSGGDEDNDAFGEQRNRSDELARTILWSKSRIWMQILGIRNQVQEMEPSTTDQSSELRKLETQLKYLWQNYQHFKIKMSHQTSAQTMSKPINVDYQSPESMDPNDRWNLYFYWINLYKDFVEKKYLELQYEHRQLSQKILEFQNMLDLDIMKEALVLGMTFTLFARLQATLQSLKCRVVVVEEAYTVSESHIVVSLTKHCENLILLGNLEESRRAARNAITSLGISMRERMMRNGMQCHLLDVQHRIRPEIVELLGPLNFPALESHNSVTTFPPVLGIQSCIYFIHHEHQDAEQYNSKTNMYEAIFLINLAVYLRQVGYQAEDIAILAAYSGQTKILWDESDRHQDVLKGVRICALDNYQGEECKIALLSLVRNNTEGKIGCLGLKDFIILALSRAKEALYMMGNIDLLCENSTIWSGIKEVLVKQSCVGSSLPVCCKVNSDHVTQIKEPKDFGEMGDSVCSRLCGRLLNCGHRCSKICHNLEDGHTATACTKLCS